MEKKLYRSTENKVIGGVCGGLGEYFEVDPTLVRVIAVVLFLATQGFALLAYIVGWVIIPKRPFIAEPSEQKREYQTSSWNKYLPGLILIGIGAILLIRSHWYWLDLDDWWPALLVLLGLVLIFRRRDKPEVTGDTEASRQESDLKNGGTVS